MSNAEQLGHHRSQLDRIEASVDALLRRHPRMVPIVGPVSEQARPAAPTPYHRCWPVNYGELLMSLSMTDSQQVPLSIGPVTDKRGNTVPTPAGSLKWSVDNPALLAATPSADSLTCVVASVGPLGDGVVTVSLVDAAGNPEATGSFAITVIAGAPAKIDIIPSNPVEQP